MTEQIEKTKAAIIGKIWINGDQKNTIFSNPFILPQDMTFNANESYMLNGNLNFLTDRHLNASLIDGEVAPLVLKAGTGLRLFKNDKRDGMEDKDPDYSVSVVLPAGLSLAIIANGKKGPQAWRDTNQTV